MSSGAGLKKLLASRGRGPQSDAVRSGWFVGLDPLIIIKKVWHLKSTQPRGMSGSDGKASGVQERDGAKKGTPACGYQY